MLNCVILQLDTYQLRIPRHQLAATGVGKMTIRSTTSTYLGGRHWPRNTSKMRVIIKWRVRKFEHKKKFKLNQTH